MKKNVNTTSGNKKNRLQAGPGNKAEASMPEVTFKEGLRRMNIKYAHAHSAYTALHINCERALAPVAGVWLAAHTRSKRATWCLSGSNIRLIRNILEFRIRDRELLYVMNAYIYGVINTASPADALLVTHDYENYIRDNRALTPLQRDILLRGFAVAKSSLRYWG